jgi:hypothetical protein
MLDQLSAEATRPHGQRQRVAYYRALTDTAGRLQLSFVPQRPIKPKLAGECLYFSGIHVT